MPRISTFLWISAGAVLGANLRYLVTRGAAHWFGPHFPFGTLIVNVAGSFLVGFLASHAATRAFPRPDVVQQLAIAGFLGSLTTFSALAWDSYSMAAGGQWGRAAINVSLSLVAGFAGVRLGVLAASLFGPAT